MKQKKQKKLVFWLGIIVIGVALGFALQFVRAWTEPTEAPPGGNLGAPINTGASRQVKKGTETVKADICVDPNGNGDEKCLSELISWPKCTLDGGVPTMVEGGITLCKFPGDVCGDPDGTHYWKPYLNYTSTTANTCTGGGNCGKSETSGFHSFDNIDPVTEMRTYYDGSVTPYQCNPRTVPTDCVYCDGYPTPCACHNHYITIYDTCYTECLDYAKPCNSIVTAIGCIQSGS